MSEGAAWIFGLSDYPPQAGRAPLSAESLQSTSTRSLPQRREVDAIDGCDDRVRSPYINFNFEQLAGPSSSSSLAPTSFLSLPHKQARESHSADSSGGPQRVKRGAPLQEFPGFSALTSGMEDSKLQSRVCLGFALPPSVLESTAASSHQSSARATGSEIQSRCSGNVSHSTDDTPRFMLPSALSRVTRPWQQFRESGRSSADMCVGSGM